MEIDPIWWDSASFEGRPVAAYLAEREISAIFRFLRTRGFSRARLAAMTGLSETRVRQIAQGRQRVTSYEVLERIATGLRIPRQRIGLAEMGEPERPHVSTAPRHPPGTTDPLIQESWDDLLGVLAGRSNALGCANLRRPVDGQIRLITAAREAATGSHRLRLLAAEARWTEFLSWIEANGRSPARTEPLLDRAHHLAIESEDRHLAAYLLMRKSQQAFDDGDAARAIALAQQGRRLDPLPPRTLALCFVREAEGHALADDAAACRESIDVALRLAGKPLDAANHLGVHCTVDYVRASEARCRQLLGESPAATKAYEEVLASWPYEARLDEGLWRAELAIAYLDEGDPERAAAHGLSALGVARATSSARSLRTVGRLLPRLRRHRHLAAVSALTSSYRAALDTCDD